MCIYAYTHIYTHTQISIVVNQMVAVYVCVRVCMHYFSCQACPHTVLFIFLAQFRMSNLQLCGTLPCINTHFLLKGSFCFAGGTFVERSGRNCNLSIPRVFSQCSSPRKLVCKRQPTPPRTHITSLPMISHAKLVHMRQGWCFADQSQMRAFKSAVALSCVEILFAETASFYRAAGISVEHSGEAALDNGDDWLCRRGE